MEENKDYFEFCGSKFGYPKDHQKMEIYTMTQKDVVYVKLEVLESHPDIRERGKRWDIPCLIEGHYETQNLAIGDFYKKLNRK